MGWGEFAALCCPARVAFAQTSPLCIDPSPSNHHSYPGWQASPLGAAPRGYLESPFHFQGLCFLSPPQVTPETPH